MSAYSEMLREELEEEEEMDNFPCSIAGSDFFKCWTRGADKAQVSRRAKTIVFDLWWLSDCWERNRNDTEVSFFSSAAEVKKLTARQKISESEWAQAVNELKDKDLLREHGCERWTMVCRREDVSDR